MGRQNSHYRSFGVGVAAVVEDLDVAMYERGVVDLTAAVQPDLARR